jgi:hypothetical protein
VDNQVGCRSRRNTRLTVTVEPTGVLESGGQHEALGAATALDVDIDEAPDDAAGVYSLKRAERRRLGGSRPASVSAAANNATGSVMNGFRPPC